MPFWDVPVTETRHYETTYRIEADSREQAAREAESGNTIEARDQKQISFEVSGVSLDEIVPVAVYVQVEYSLRYRGGDYDGVGDFAYIPDSLQDPLTEDNIAERFKQHTNIDPIHIIHFDLDELFNAEGECLG